MVDGAVIGISCDEKSCLQHDAETARCRLVPPVATHDIKFVFALERCPIARTLGSALTRAGHAPKDADAARRAALDVYERDAAPPGSRVIDHVVDALRERGGADPHAPVKDEDAARIARGIERVHGPSRRQGIGPVNAAALMVFAALLALLGWSKWSGEDPVPTDGLNRLLRLEPDRDLAAAGRVAFEIKLRGRAYVSVYALPEDGGPVRLFPGLAPPVGIPWPLEDDGGETWRIPSRDGDLPLPRGRGRVVVLAGKQRAPDIVDEFRGRSPTDEEIRETWPIARVWAYGADR